MAGKAISPIFTCMSAVPVVVLFVANLIDGIVVAHIDRNNFFVLNQQF